MNPIAYAFDTETTGLLLPSTVPLDKQPQIIELAIVRFERVTGEEPATEHWRRKDDHSWLINPGKPLTPEIVRITGLKDEDLAGKPSFAEVLPEITAFVLGAACSIAHNHAFDLGMLLLELRRLGKEHAFPFAPQQICTVDHFRPEWGRRMKLPELYEKKLGKPLAQTHRALDDTNALAEIVLAAGVLE